MGDCSNSVTKYIVVQPSADGGVFSGMTVCGGGGLTVDFITGCTSDGVNVGGGIFNNGVLTIPTINGTTFSGGTYYGDGSNLTGISTIDSYMTGGTYSNGFITFSGSGVFSNVSVDVSALIDDTNSYVTGGTVTGTDLILGRNGGLSNVTIDTSSYFDNTDNYVTGATMNSNTLELSRSGGLSNVTVDLSQFVDDTNDGVVSGATMNGNTLELSRTEGLGLVTVDLSQFLDDTNFYVTGSTLNGNTLELGRNGGLSTLTTDLSQFLDDTNSFVTGTTFNNTTYDLTLFRNNGESNIVSNLAALASDVYVLSGVYNPSTGIVTYTNNSGNTFQVSGFTTGMTDSYTTAVNLNGNTIEFDNNIQGSSLYSVDLTPILSGFTSTDYYVTGATMNGTNLELGRNGLPNVTVDLGQFLDDTNVTGFTYNNANLLTISQSDGTSYTTTINNMTGLTVNGLFSGDSISINGGEVMTRIVDTQDFRLYGNMAGSGVIYYEGLSANTIDNTKFDLGPVRGWIVDNTTDPMNPTVQYIDYSGSTGDSPSGVTLTFLATNPASYIGLAGNATADIVQSMTRYTPSQHRDLLEVGTVVHSNNTTVNAINNFAAIAIDPLQQTYDLIHALSIFNIEGERENIFSANGTNLNIDKTGGEIFSHGSNYLIDPKNPHIKDLASASTITFRYRLPDGTEFGSTTEVDPNTYDNGGVTAVTPNNKFTVQRITLFANNFTRWQYGQHIYDSLDDAEASLSTESFNIEPAISNGLLRAFVIVKQGTEDLSNTKEARFISANHFGHANDTVVGNTWRTEILNHSSTGLRNGGILSVNIGDTATFDISAGTGLVIDNTTNPDNPTLTEVAWDTITGVTLTALTGESGTFITLNSSASVVQYSLSTPPIGGDKRNNIYLGLVGHGNGVSIDNIFNTPITLISPINQHEDLTSSIGPFSIAGNRVSSIAGTLQLEKTSGRSYFYGGNYQIDNTNPSVFNTVNLSASTLVYATGVAVLGPSGATVDTQNYDPDGLGVVTSISNPNDVTTHRIWHQPSNNTLALQYGQHVYATKAGARDAIETENYIVPAGLSDVAYLVAILITEASSDNINLDDAIFIPQGKFAGSGGGGGGSVDTLQTAYNNSTQPEILTDGTRGSVDFRIGSGADTDNAVTVQQNDGTINSFITGLGDAVFNTLSGITGVDFNLSSTDNFLIDGETNLRGVTVGAIRQLHKPSIPGTRAYNFQIDANGYGDTKGTEVNFLATSYTSGLTSTVHNINIDTNNATGGIIEGYRVDKVGNGTLDVHALVIGAEIDVIKHSSGVGGDMGIAFTGDTSFTSFADVTSAFTNTVINTEMFVSNNDYVVIGDTSKFNKLSFLLDTPSDGVGMLPTFEYSSGLSGWTSFTPVDNTNGFRQNGAIVYNIDDLGSWVTDTVNGVSSMYWVRVRRTNSITGVTIPIEDVVQITTPQNFEWDKGGNVRINNIYGDIFSGNTVPAVYYGDGSNLTGIVHTTDNYVSGGTYSNGSIDFSGTSTNQSFSVDVSALLDNTNYYVTGQTLNGTTLETSRNGGLTTLTTELSGLTSGGGSGASVSLPWKFSTSVTESDPGSKFFRFNNIDASGTTEIYVNDFTNNGVDSSTILSSLDVSDRIYVQQNNDATKAYLFRISASTIDNTGWFTIPVEFETGDGDSIPDNNKECGWVMFSLGSENNTVSNVGVGQGVYKQKTGANFEFRSISGGTNTTVSLNGDTIVIDTIDTDTNSYVTGGTVSGTDLVLGRNGGLSNVTINTSAYFDNVDNYVTGATMNVNTLELSRSGGLGNVTVDLSQFIDDTNSYVTGSTLNGNTLELSRNGGLSTLSTDLSSLGSFTSFNVSGDTGQETITDGSTLLLYGGEGILSTVSATDTVTHRLDITGTTVEGSPASGAKLIIYQGGEHRNIDWDDLPGSGGGETNTASNLSTTGLFAQKNGVNLEFKGLTSTGGTVTISNNATTVNIESSGGGNTVNDATKIFGWYMNIT